MHTLRRITQKHNFPESVLSLTHNPKKAVVNANIHNNTPSAKNTKSLNSFQGQTTAEEPVSLFMQMYKNKKDTALTTSKTRLSSVLLLNNILGYLSISEGNDSILAFNTHSALLYSL